MFGSTTLDIVIGLIFVFLLYSLLATIIQEIVATWMGMRAKTLEKAIIRMLNDGRTEIKIEGKWWERILKWLGSGIYRTWERFRSYLFMIKPGSYKGTLADKFYKQPSIKFLAEDAWHSKPDYMGAKNFSKALIDLLRGDDIKPGDDIAAKIKSLLFPETEEDKERLKKLNIEGETLNQLKAYLVDANNDMEKFKEYIEGWFDETMKRATGWYKRYVQIVLFMIGFGIAVTFNVDAIKIASILSEDKDARAQLVELAKGADKYETLIHELDSIKTIDSNTTTPKPEVDQKELVKRKNYLDSTYSIVKEDIDNVNSVLAIGWKIPYEKNSKYCELNFGRDAKKLRKCKACMKKFEGEEHRKLSTWEKFRFMWRTQVTGKSILGWIITALAISMGAAFWFDLLNKFMKLRGAGQRPELKGNDKPDSKTKTA